MRLLIDGYNLLHATDLFGRGVLKGTLRGSREALLERLASALPEKLRKQSVIVFDSNDAPPGLPDRYEYEGLRVWFARGYPDADALIEQILYEASGTRHLTVVSSDRRVQRAARSRGAKPVDSTEWFSGLSRATPQGPEAKSVESIEGAAHWVSEFSDPEALRAIEQEAASAPPPKPLPPQPAKPAEKPRKKKRREPPAAPSKGEFGEGVFDPFPPGYAQDLLGNLSNDDADQESSDDR